MALGHTLIQIGKSELNRSESQDDEGSIDAAALAAIEFLALSKHGPASQIIQDSAECNNEVLEKLDDCVTCVEGVHSQQEFEVGVDRTKELIHRSFTTCHSLSPDEVAQIRYQIMESVRERENASQDLLYPGIDDLNVCGFDVGAAQPAVVSEVHPGLETADESFSERYGNAEVNPYLVCAVCRDQSTDTRKVAFCQFPCCTEDAGVRVCTTCLLVLMTSSSDRRYRLGHCPRCKSWIRVRTPLTVRQPQLEIELITLEEPVQACKTCNQTKTFFVDDQECDACFLGQRHPLLYECQSCQCAQRIPHPLYRYQESPDAYTSVQWSCLGHACGKFTYWRLLSDQIRFIPVGDAPASWQINSIMAAQRKVEETKRSVTAVHGDPLDDCLIL